MCRMLAMMGMPSTHSINTYEKMVSALVSSAYYDPYAKRIFGPKGSSHKHGWGRATLYLDSGNISYSIIKHMHPIYVKKPEIIPGNSVDSEYFKPFIIDLIHARAASPDTEVSIFNVQPFEFSTRTGEKLIIAHNGSVDKERLVSEIGSLVPEGVANRYSDTFMLGQSLSTELGKSFDISTIKRYKEYVKSALNLIAVLIAEGEIQVLFGSYFINADHAPYYRLYLKNERNSLIVSSSTAIDYYYDDDISSWIPINNGEFYIGKIKYGEGMAKLSELTKHSIL
ncbi:MAG: hypothetical protein QW039_06590 [Fervidicoccaceae archaeon]